MFKRPILAVLAACLLLAPAGLAQAAPVPVAHLDLSTMMGRWYEVARVPNIIQKDCEAGASEWTPESWGFAVVQSCHKGTPSGPLAVWKARATVADPQTNAKFRMSFFGGIVTQNYVVVEHRADQGWLALATADGKYLWLMSQRPILPAAIKAQALARIRQLGFDIGRLEFPLPPSGD